jgi:hypothetical protein
MTGTVAAQRFNGVNVAGTTIILTNESWPN